MRYLPPGSWLDVHASAPDGRFLDLHAPAITYPDAEIRISIERDKPTIGIYRLHRDNLPASVARIANQPIGVLANVQRIDIATRVEVVETPALELIVDGQRTLLRELAAGNRGTPLAELVAGHRGDRIRVIGPSELVLARSQVDADPGGFTLKRTHRNIYVFRSATDELRDVRRLVLE